MAEDRRYLPPRERSIDQLAKTYERLNASPLGRAEVEGPERPADDPLGLKEAPPDPMESAKEGTVRLVRFFMLLAQEFRLDAEGMLFMAELAALNILNARDIPLPKARQDEIRRKAYEYYRASLPRVPDPVAPKG